jgi:hypothetical protein
LFNPYLYTGSIRGRLGCGVTALALLTGIAPENISCKDRCGHHPDEFMVDFLRNAGYEVLELTLCNLSTGSTLIDREHVILLSQLFRKNEATWGVIHNGWYYHNFTIYSVETLSFLNKPILSAYLVLHPRWRGEPENEEERPLPVKLRKHGFPFSTLGISQKRKSKQNDLPCP